MTNGNTASNRENEEDWEMTIPDRMRRYLIGVAVIIYLTRQMIQTLRHEDFRKILLKIISILLQLVPDNRQASTLAMTLQCWQQS